MWNYKATLSGGNNRNVNGNSVEKHGMVMLNVKLQEKATFKTFN